jgi:hypothetical protein
MAYFAGSTHRGAGQNPADVCLVQSIVVRASYKYMVVLEIEVWGEV